MWKFGVYEDAGGKNRWRLKTDNGQIVASSGESFFNKQNAERAAEDFKANAASANYEVYEDAGRKWRWRARAANGQMIASSGGAFASRANARQATDNVKASAGSATIP
jgi:uncharacterized protein YegP (UPF0339 family)